MKVQRLFILKEKKNVKKGLKINMSKTQNLGIIVVILSISRGS